MGNSAKQFFASLAAALLAFWVVLSILGAFLGADKARLFFNSPPLMLFWAMLLAAFLSGFWVWPPLRRQPTMLLCHLGCALVLLGGLVGSPAAYWARQRLGLEKKTFKSYLELSKGQASDIAFADQTDQPIALPFTVRLADARALYYDAPTLGIFTPDGQLVARLPIEIGQTAALSDDCRVELARRFDNLRLSFDPQTQQMRGEEGDRAAVNPGYELVYWFSDGRQLRQYVFEHRRGHGAGGLPFQAVYLRPQMPKRYESDLVIERDGAVVAQKTIRVNDPLHYGGYHFYQHTFAQRADGAVSGIMIVSDSGVAAVFVGYALTAAGVCGQFWLKPIWRRWRRGSGGDAS